MAGDVRTVALLAAKPALASILAATLASSPRLRVRSFDGMLGLLAYARIVEIDLVVADLDDGVFDPELMECSAVPTDVAVIGLTRRPAATEGVDEVIAKPMSPRYLLERVLARARTRRAPTLALVPRVPVDLGNVVPFPAQDPHL
jgi:hypothetical protein